MGNSSSHSLSFISSRKSPVMSTTNIYIINYILYNMIMLPMSDLYHHAEVVLDFTSTEPEGFQEGLQFVFKPTSFVPKKEEA